MTEYAELKREVQFLCRESASQLPLLKDTDHRRSLILGEIRAYQIVMEMIISLEKGSAE